MGGPGEPCPSDGEWLKEPLSLWAGTEVKVMPPVSCLGTPLLKGVLSSVGIMALMALCSPTAFPN